MIRECYLYVSILWDFLRFSWQPNIWLIFMNIPRALQKMVYFLFYRYRIQYSFIGFLSSPFLLNNEQETKIAAH